ncbi:MAG: cupredoxin domain-containing protein [Actinomycetota bacterium]
MTLMKGISLTLALAVLAPLSGAQAGPGATDTVTEVSVEDAAVEPTDGYIFAAGGTPLSNGLFFPGTAFCSGGECETQGSPARVAEGEDVTFTNLDLGTFSGIHQIISREEKKKKKKKKKPLFSSEPVDGPGQVQIRTSHLKPGVYFYYCSTHFGMDGALEVYEP